MGQMNLAPLPRVVFDLETKRSFAEVGGRDRMQDLGISLGVVYDFSDDTYHVYRDDEIEGLVRHLLRASLLIGFNVDGFDIPVLGPYLPVPAPRFKTLDLMGEAKKPLGFRPSLNKLAGATLGESKAGDGLEALRWYREGRWDDLIHYCKEDVRITRDLYLYGRDHGYLLFPERDGQIVRVPVNWS
ncbi:MAG TPA: ribonuclease H-like domain-containing protein [Thermoanaerobaculia bacterium]|nr:ribonuclease H-like domain-containing protein [Thermoanaerobaculia bacterium]HUM29474.1 ribonuclease H-like domain-containing protein [Thermoanaerobaculia bacterium]HXK67857.1 ribonuclease H-like domain-containing protein [Thermoanaerobaculia bacterium]